MDEILYETLDNINEGIAIMDRSLQVVFWNKNMEKLSRIKADDAVGVCAFCALPGLNREYFHKMFGSVFEDGRKMFLSAAMHRDIIEKKDINLRLSRLVKDDDSFMLMEFIDVTSQFLRVNQLKKNVDELCTLNHALKEKEKTINRLAYYDGLTGLANRILFYKFAEKFEANAGRTGERLGLMFLDVDNFKDINDTYGHQTGDEVLLFVTEVLKKSIRKVDLAARFGGDEFLILLHGVRDREDCAVTAERIKEGTKIAIRVSGVEIKVSLSIGISLLPDDALNIDELISKADRAMYEAKNNGGNGYEFFCKKVKAQ